MTDVNADNVEPIMTALAEILGERPAVVVISNDVYIANGDACRTYTIIETPDPTEESESWIENDDAEISEVADYLRIRESLY